MDAKLKNFSGLYSCPLIYNMKFIEKLFVAMKIVFSVTKFVGKDFKETYRKEVE
jgi:hypothetical protein